MDTFNTESTHSPHIQHISQHIQQISEQEKKRRIQNQPNHTPLTTSPSNPNQQQPTYVQDHTRVAHQDHMTHTHPPQTHSHPDHSATPHPIRSHAQRIINPQSETSSTNNTHPHITQHECVWEHTALPIHTTWMFVRTDCPINTKRMWTQRCVWEEHPVDTHNMTTCEDTLCQPNAHHVNVS
jgi:hypothetical protein